MSCRKICVVTGTRADYGLLYWLMREVEADEQLTLQLVATGMHLSPEFGFTHRLIEEDGFHITGTVEMLLSSDSPVGITKSLGLGVVGFADLFERLQPDIVVVLGDRFEIFAAAQAALIGRYPLAHIHGGESTEGVIDEAIRHAITKLASLHFVAADTYRDRVIQLGENPSRVFNFGAPGLDNIRKLDLMSRDELELDLGLELRNRSFLITYHPETLLGGRSEQSIRELLTALNAFHDAQIIFTQSNSDTEGRIIRNMIEEYRDRHPDRVRVYVSMGQTRYLSALKHVDVVIGNSSSGILEAPALHTPTVNIGDRQTGRLKAASIIDCEINADAISRAIRQALSSEFRQIAAVVESPYGDGDTSHKIKECLKSINLSGITRKQFYDIGKSESPKDQNLDCTFDGR